MSDIEALIRQRAKSGDLVGLTLHFTTRGWEATCTTTGPQRPLIANHADPLDALRAALGKPARATQPAPVKVAAAKLAAPKMMDLL